MARLPLWAQPWRWRAELKERRISRRTRGSPDRVFLVERILPVFAARGGRILWVGCRRYTDDYPAILEAQGAECWTTEIDPEAAPFGRRGRHRTGDIVEVATLFADVSFDAILCNGVLGYGVDSLDAQAKALAGMADRLKPSGRLMLGWNIDKIDDPLTTGVLPPTLRPQPLGDLAARIPIEGKTHVYDFLEKT